MVALLCLVLDVIFGEKLILAAAPHITLDYPMRHHFENILSYIGKMLLFPDGCSGKVDVSDFDDSSDTELSIRDEIVDVLMTDELLSNVNAASSTSSSESESEDSESRSNELDASESEQDVIELHENYDDDLLDA